MNIEHYVEDPNLSIAWGKAIRMVSARGHKEIVPLVVSITGFDATGRVLEEPGIRSALDNLLSGSGLQGVDTVAGTIFPSSMWNASADRKQLFSRYQKVFPRLQKASAKNRRGIYFQRMISGGPPAQPNQLEFVIGSYMARTGVRRSILQIGIFDPAKDHSTAAQLGFPCLQHVTFAPVDDQLSVNAFYATQFLVERAYGNYIGLCRLGQFVAHEMGLKLSRVTCFSGIAECDVGKGELAPILAAIDQVVAR